MRQLKYLRSYVTKFESLVEASSNGIVPQLVPGICIGCGNRRPGICKFKENNPTQKVSVAGS